MLTIFDPVQPYLSHTEAVYGELVFRHTKEEFPGLYRPYHKGIFSLFYVVNDVSLSHHNLLY